MKARAMKNRAVVTTALACAAAFAAVIISSLPVQAEPGGTTATFLTVPVGGRAVALGGAYTALCEDAYAMHYNPAALALSPHEIVFAHNEYILDLSQEYLAYAHPLDVGTVGASVNYFDLGKFDRTVIVGPVTNPTNFASRGRFDASNFALAVGYGRQLFVEGLYLGLAAKYIDQRIDDFSGHTAAADVGALYHKPGSPLSLGVSVLNIGDKIRMQSRNDRIPLTVRVGAAFRVIPDRLLLTADISKIVADDKYYPQAGIEYWVASMFALRAGWDGTSDAGNGLRLGAGVRVQQFSLDYAWGDEDELDMAHRISIGYRF